MPSFPQASSLNRAWLPYLALGFGVIALGFSALFVRWANAPGPVVGFYRLGISTLILLPFFVIRRRGGMKITWAILIFPILGLNA